MRLAALALLFAAAPALAEDFGAWKPLTNPFPSTGGGGVMIHDYDPVVSGKTCTTDFSARSGQDRFDGEVVFDAAETQGGVLCANGRWRMKDGSATGTTPFRVFIRDGVKRGDPL
ncbi:MAG TPA: hypothetical protein PK812_09045 [Beijerinckiaceae bacterium]|nr:hypothetical protein [Beijerinckiaceae bacterium]